MDSNYLHQDNFNKSNFESILSVNKVDFLISENQQLKKTIEIIKRRHELDRNLLKELLEEQSIVELNKQTSNEKHKNNKIVHKIQSEFESVMTDIQNKYHYEVEYLKNDICKLKDEIKQLSLDNNKLLNINNDLESEISKSSINIKKLEYHYNTSIELQEKIKEIEEENSNLLTEIQQLESENYKIKQEFMDIKQMLQENMKLPLRPYYSLIDEENYNSLNLLEELKQISCESLNYCELLDMNEKEKNQTNIVYLELKILIEEIKCLYKNLYTDKFNNLIGEQLLINEINLHKDNNHFLQQRILKLENEFRRKQLQVKTWNYLSQTNQNTTASIINLEMSKYQHELNEKNSLIDKLRNQLTDAKDRYGILINERDSARRETQMTRLTCDQYEIKLLEMNQILAKYQKKIEKITNLKKFLSHIDSSQNHNMKPSNSYNKTIKF